MFDTNAVKADFSRAAATYDSAAQLQRRVRLHALSLARWSSGSQILDLGCGTGAFAQEVSQRRLGWQVSGVDISAGMCGTAKGRMQSVINADAEALPFADASFDGVFSSLMLQWANTPSCVWHEMARVLRPGGRCVISTLTQGTLKELRAAFAAVDDAPHLSDFMSGEDIKNDAMDMGFRLLAVETATFTEHYPDAVRLMQSLKAIGATNKHSARRKGLMTPFQLARIEREYQDAGASATWQLLYILADRP